MKKFLSLCMTFLLLWQMLAIPPVASAAEPSADVVFYFSKDKSATTEDIHNTDPIPCVAGETLTLALKVKANVPYSTIGIHFKETDGTQYYPKIFSNLRFADTEYLISKYANKNATGFDHNDPTQPISVTMRSSLTYSGYICELQFQVAAYAAPGIYTIGEGLFNNVRNNNASVTSAVQPVQIKVTHNNVLIPAVEPTCEKVGNTEYYVCYSCDQLYTDEFCKNLTTEAAITIPVGSHTMAIAKDDTHHWQECSVCHTTANMTEHTIVYRGEKDGHRRVCAGCPWESEELLDHSNGENSYNAGSHWNQCPVCKYTEEAVEHTFQYKSDSTGHWEVCTECKYNNTKPETVTAHKYVYKSNDAEHWQECSVCRWVKEGSQTAHVDKDDDGNPLYGIDTSFHWTECSACGYKSEKVAHTTNRTFTKTKHMDTCSECKKITNEAAHTYVTRVDGNDHFQACTSCDWTGERTAHTWTTRYNNDGHWKVCTGCGTSTDDEIEAHIPVLNRDNAGHWDTCSVCDWKSTLIEHDLSDNFNYQSHWQECSVCRQKIGNAFHDSKTQFTAEDGHWQICTGCDWKTDPVPHELTEHSDDNGSWEACTECNYISTTEKHTLVTKYSDAGHWQQCTDCGWKSTTTSHTYPDQYTSDATHHWFACACGHKNNITAHTDSYNKWNSDGIYHYHVCVCGAVIDKTSHVGPAPTCKEPAKCSICAASFGTKSTTHGKLVTVGAYAATCSSVGSTGTKYCTVCSEAVEAADVIPSTGAHKAIDLTWYVDKNNHHYQLCGGKDCTEQIYPTEREHTGGTQTCKSLAVCSICKLSYDKNETDSQGNPIVTHVGPFEVDESTVIVATCEEQGYTGNVMCACGELYKRGETIPVTGDHHDADGMWETTPGNEFHWYTCNCGTEFNHQQHHTKSNFATCTTVAVCDDCGASFGSLDRNNHVGETYLDEKSIKIATCVNEGNTGNRHCAKCDAMVRTGTPVNPTGKHIDADGKWNSDETGHFNKCDCGAKYNRHEHTYIYKTNPAGHKQICSVCDFEPDKGNTDHKTSAETTYFWDTNHHYAICDLCKGRGTPQKHVIDKETGECKVCDYKDMTVVEVKLKAKDLIDQNKDILDENNNTENGKKKTITDTNTITAILDLMQHVEANAAELAELDEEETTEEQKTADKVSQMLEKVDLISVDTTSGNATANNAASDTAENTSAVRISGNVDSALKKSIDAELAGSLSQAIREADAAAKTDPTASRIPPTLVMAVNVEPAQETAPGMDIAREYVADTVHTDTQASLVIESQLDISVESKLMVGGQVQSSTTLTELADMVEITIPLPREEVDKGKVFVILHTHIDENGTVTTEVLPDIEKESGWENGDDRYTYTIRTNKFSIFTAASVEPMLSAAVTGTEVTVTVDNPCDGQLITAVYDSNHVMKGLDIKVIDMDTATTDDTLTLGTKDNEEGTTTTETPYLSYSPSITYETGDTVRVFFLNENYIPLCPAAIYPEETTTK